MNDSVNEIARGFTKQREVYEKEIASLKKQLEEMDNWFYVNMDCNFHEIKDSDYPTKTITHLRQQLEDYKDRLTHEVDMIDGAANDEINKLKAELEVSKASGLKAMELAGRMAHEIRNQAGQPMSRNPKLQRNFAETLDSIAVALKDLEWYYSCDSSWELAEKSINEVFYGKQNKNR